MARDKEPITPFIARIGALARSGVSAVLVMGGSGDYFGALGIRACGLPFCGRADVPKPMSYCVREVK